MKRILVIVGIVVLVAILAVVGVVGSAFMGGQPIPDGLRLDGVQVVKDSFVSVDIVDLGPGEVALIDAGNDRQAGAVLAALKARGLGAEAVKAIFLTHGDDDHTRGAPMFPQAVVMGLAEDVDLAEGKVVRMVFASPRPSGCKVTRVIKDGELVEVGGTRVEVFAVPGHTSGSAAFLARGVLFLGDSAETTGDGQLATCAWLFCSDRPTNRLSLQALAERLAGRAGEVRAIACSHSGVLERGLAPLTELAARLGS